MHKNLVHNFVIMNSKPIEKPLEGKVKNSSFHISLLLKRKEKTLDRNIKKFKNLLNLLYSL